MTFRWIIGLGNPGTQYEDTRHNAGFVVVDRLAEKLDVRWDTVGKTRALVALDRSSGLALCKPQAFMNASGQAAREAMEYVDKQVFSSATLLEKTVLVYDDLDLQIGTYKIQFGKHPKIHNGVDSIIETFGTDQFVHARVGTDARNGDRSIPSDAYVLMPFQKEERPLFDASVEAIIKELYAALLSQ